MGHVIHHSIGPRAYVITVHHDEVHIRGDNELTRRTCIAGWESIPQVCRSRGEALTSALTELWSWTTGEPIENLEPALRSAQEMS
jgi:hypothetical protein